MRAAEARRELFSSIGWCPPILSTPLSEEEVGLVLGAALQRVDYSECVDEGFERLSDGYEGVEWDVF